MFKFGFSEDDFDQDKNHREIHSELKWYSALEINVSEEQIDQDYDEKNCTTIDKICDLNIKLIRPESVVLNLKDDEHENIIKAESQHSDLIPAVYEGGLKVWECSYDLGKFLLTQNILLKNKKVLDLGCGAGVLGIIALLSESTVHFQDYNREVIELLTIPNVLLNLNDRRSIPGRVKFYAGDWSTFNDLLLSKYPDEDEKYDIILSSETIYNSDNQIKLYNVFKERLKNSGVGYIAGKTHYFGVGGGMRQFEKIIKDDNIFNIESVWKSDQGLQREIMTLTRR